MLWNILKIALPQTTCLTFKRTIQSHRTEFCGNTQRRGELCVSVKLPKLKKKMLDYILRLFFKAEFPVFQEVMGIINDQWPTLSKERNKIAEALWAASNVSLTKSNFYQVRECSGTSTPEREREDTQRGPCVMGQTGRWNATSCAPTDTQRPTAGSVCCSTCWVNSENTHQVL